VLLGALALAGLGAIAFASSLERTLQSPRPSRMLVDRRGRYLGEVPGNGHALGFWPPPEALPQKMVRATLSAEDRHFFEHGGVRPQAIARALWQNVKNRRVVSGASTVAMQVARLQSPAARSLGHKAREMAEAILLVRAHGREKVLRQYLTLAPYGNNVCGAARAARLYFDKPLEDVSWLQAAFLAALPQAPGHMNPYEPEGRARAMRRARRILHALRSEGALSEDELRQALASDLRVVPKPRRESSALHAVLALSARLGRSAPPISIATLDLDLQAMAARAVADEVARLSEEGAGNGAALVVDTATGEVLASVGSRDYFSQEHRGSIDYVKVKRSPGSALKPFIYALALQKGRFTAASELPDTPIELPAGPGRSYLPENVNHHFQGPMLLREALGNSRNIPALEVLSEVGIEPVLALLERGGVREVSFEPGRYGLGLALGALPVTLEELAGLYLALASGGEARPLRRFAGEPAQARSRLVTREAAQLVTSILSDPMARRPAFPSGGPLDFDYAVAVKTGTSQGARDAWAVGYSDRLLVAVWIGNHDARRMNRVSGASAAGAAFHAIMEAAMPQMAPHRPVAAAFAVPERFVSVDICPLSGRQAGALCPHHRAEIFAPGTEPTQTCPFHAMVKLDARNGLRAGPLCQKRFLVERPMLDLPAAYETWAASQRLEIAPRTVSPLCRDASFGEVARVAIKEPRPNSRYLWDPDTPREAAALRLAAKVEPPDEEIVWIVDGAPLAKVGYPHAVRWSPTPGSHTIAARMVRRAEASGVVTIVVEN
jgi:penicillin-binding protein 1C